MALGTSYQESDIAYEEGLYFALKVRYGFDVYKCGVTHATRCARIGFKGEDGLKRVKEEITRRIQKDAAK